MVSVPEYTYLLHRLDTVYYWNRGMQGSKKMGCLNDQVNMVEREQTYIERCWFLLWFGGRLDVGCRFFTLLSRFRKSSAPSSFSSCSVGLASESMLCVNPEILSVPQDLLLL